MTWHSYRSDPRDWQAHLSCDRWQQGNGIPVPTPVHSSPVGECGQRSPSRTQWTPHETSSQPSTLFSFNFLVFGFVLINNNNNNNNNNNRADTRATSRITLRRRADEISSERNQTRPSLYCLIFTLSLMRLNVAPDVTHNVFVVLRSLMYCTAWYDVVRVQLHLVHWNEDLYDSFEEAAKREDGIVIIAVFIKVPLLPYHLRLSSLLSLIKYSYLLLQ